MGMEGDVEVEGRGRGRGMIVVLGRVVLKMWKDGAKDGAKERGGQRATDRGGDIGMDDAEVVDVIVAKKETSDEDELDDEKRLNDVDDHDDDDKRKKKRKSENLERDGIDSNEYQLRQSYESRVEQPPPPPPPPPHNNNHHHNHNHNRNNDNDMDTLNVLLVIVPNHRVRHYEIGNQKVGKHTANNVLIKREYQQHHIDHQHQHLLSD